LEEYHGKRIAVIQNEFGMRTGIEESMVMVGQKGKAEKEWLELPNGCLCCTVKDDLVASIESLMQRKDRFDYILIETTGMADPGKVASIFWLDDELDADLYLDAVVTVVDSRNLMRHLRMSSLGNDADDALGKLSDEERMNEAERQIVFADVLVLNKLDLVGASDLDRLRGVVRQLNADAKVLTSTFSRVDLDELFDIGAFDPKRAIAIDSSLAPVEAEHTHNGGETCTSASCGTAAASTSAHDGTVATVNIVEQVSVDYDEIETWIGSLLWLDDEAEGGVGGGADIYRVKGVVSIVDDEQKYAVHGVHDLFEVRESGIRWKADEPRITKLVFIGRRLAAVKLVERFRRQFLAQQEEKKK
jgi:G3E family GTPase